VSQAIRTQVFCSEGFEQHGEIAADKDHTGRKAGQHLKRRTVHNRRPPFLDSKRSDIFAGFLDHHRFVIRPVAEVHFCHLIAFEDNQVGADAVEEKCS
jgi:hypothetical protein